MKYTEKLNKEIDKLLADAEATRSNIEKRKAKAEAEKTEAQAALNEAAEANDDVKYHQAKEKLRFANDTIEMCSNRLKSLEGSLCSSDKNADVVDQIDEEIRKAAKAAEKKAASLVAELYKAAQELDATITENNAVKTRWATEVMKTSASLAPYNKELSEVLYLGKIIRQRITVTPSLKDAGRSLMCIYDSIR